MVKNILLYGKIGAGKSTVANKIIGSELFKISGSMKESCTRSVQSGEVLCKDGVHKFVIYDTPGIGDRNDGPWNWMEELKKLSSRQIHLVVYVTNSTKRMSREFLIWRIVLGKCFHDFNTKHWAFILTRCDKDDRSEEKETEEYMKNLYVNNKLFKEPTYFHFGKDRTTTLDIQKFLCKASGEDEKKSYNNVPRSRPQRVLSSTLNDKKKVLKSSYTFLSLQRYRESPPVWKSFDAKKNYIGVLDLKKKVCYVDDPGLFREVEMATQHKKLMVELGRWESYEKWKNNPREHYYDLLGYAGFAYHNGEWKPNSCTLNAAPSGKSEWIVLKALEGAGRTKGDVVGKKHGLNIMKPFLWNPLKAQLDEMTK